MNNPSTLICARPASPTTLTSVRARGTVIVSSWHDAVACIVQK
ncbi:hypothetical protein HMPREF9603_00824 [Cutibacterium acnes HL001PA1]|nr:hypothetical protein HMPREF9603_00824 [Cutibacterium acnes HL001PA1]